MHRIVITVQKSVYLLAPICMPTLCAAHSGQHSFSASSLLGEDTSNTSSCVAHTNLMSVMRRYWWCDSTKAHTEAWQLRGSDGAAGLLQIRHPRPFPLPRSARAFQRYLWQSATSAKRLCKFFELIVTRGISLLWQVAEHTTQVAEVAGCLISPRMVPVCSGSHANMLKILCMQSLMC